MYIMDEITATIFEVADNWKQEIEEALPKRHQDTDTTVDMGISEPNLCLINDVTCPIKGNKIDCVTTKRSDKDDSVHNYTPPSKSGIDTKFFTSPKLFRFSLCDFSDDEINV